MPVPFRAIAVAAILSLFPLRGHASDGGPAQAPTPASYTYEVVAVYPHDRDAFTQGLVYVDGQLYETTGLNGHSTFRKVDLKTGRVLKQVKLDETYFGEGMTILGDKAYQITWRSKVGFVYNLETFTVEKQFSYTGEGWGLTTDGKWLILSDGTDEIRFLDPADFKVVRTIHVSNRGEPIKNLNELEYIKGEIYANVWQTNWIVRIDPANGALLGVINLAHLLASEDYTANTDVLNGIAYDAANDRLFVTGKDWPKLFEIRLKPAAKTP